MRLDAAQKSILKLAEPAGSLPYRLRQQGNYELALPE
jgi:hypothetical protein